MMKQLQRNLAKMPTASRRRLTAAAALLAVVLLVTGIPSFSSLFARKSGTIINDSTIVYTAPSDSSSHLCRLNKSTKVTVIEETKDAAGTAWYGVYFLHSGEAKDGYIQASQIQFGGGSSSSGSSSSNGSSNSSDKGQVGKTGSIIKANVNIRSAATTSSTSLYRLSKGTQITVMAEEKGSDGYTWYKVYFVYGGSAKEGFVRSDMVTGLRASSGENNGASSDTAATNVNKSGTIKKRNTNIRSGGSLDHSVLYRLAANTPLNISQELKNADGSVWYKVNFTYDGKSAEGYVRSDMVKLSSATSNGTVPGTVKKANINVRTQATTNSSRICTLAKGTRVSIQRTVTGSDGMSWYQVSFTYGNQTKAGYIRSDLVSR